MKLLVLLLLLFSEVTFADNWICPTDLELGKFSGFELKDQCAKSCDPEKCENLDPEKLDEKKITVIQVDDSSKPIYEAASNVTVCLSPGDCEQIISNVSFCADGMLKYYRQVDQSTFEAYCTKILGFQQKSVKKFEDDAARIAAKLALQSAAETQRTKRKARTKKLKDFLDIATPTLDETRTHLKVLIKEVLSQDE